MSKTVTTRYDVAEHLRTPEEMAAYLEACLKKLTEMPHSSLKPLAISLVLRACPRLREIPGCRAKVFTRRFPVNAALTLTLS